ncbi:Cyclin-dependent protein kinase inhibitor SMR13, partial [Mucuna pruriens]
MVPSRRTTKKKTRGKPARNHFRKKQHPESRKQETSSTEKKRKMDSDVAVAVAVAACSTPKGQKFRIPQVSTCPPAPKKPRVLSNCSLRRSPLTFFAPPDLDIFFCVALRDLPKIYVPIVLTLNLKCAECKDSRFGFRFECHSLQFYKKHSMPSGCAERN